LPKHTVVSDSLNIFKNWLDVHMDKVDWEDMGNELLTAAHFYDDYDKSRLSDLKYCTLNSAPIASPYSNRPSTSLLEIYGGYSGVVGLRCTPAMLLDTRKQLFYRCCLSCKQILQPAEINVGSISCFNCLLSNVDFSTFTYCNLF
jgi:hypothetical protein